MTSSLKLEAGKTYRDSCGRVKGPLQAYPPGCTTFVVVIGDGEIWDRYGVSGGSYSDLVEEVREPKYDFQHEITPDPVNRPSHYTQGGVECIDAIKAAMSGDEFRGYLRGNVIKYLWRYKLKGGSESLAKAQWYLARLQSEIA